MLPLLIRLALGGVIGAGTGKMAKDQLPGGFMQKIMRLFAAPIEGDREFRRQTLEKSPAYRRYLMGDQLRNNPYLKPAPEPNYPTSLPKPRQTTTKDLYGLDTTWIR